MPDHVADIAWIGGDRDAGRFFETPALNLQLLIPEDAQTHGGGEGIADWFRKVRKAVGGHAPSVDGGGRISPMVPVGWEPS